MNKKVQDLAWACLPKEARNRIKIAYKSDYVSDRGYQPTRGMEVLQDIFGSHNLTSDTEPEKEGDTNVPKPKFMPRFSIGDIVKVNEKGKYEGIVAEIISIDHTDPTATYYLDNGPIFENGKWFADKDVEPYTEENKETMEEKNRCEKCGANAQQCADSPCQNYPAKEEKELDLCELLKGCEGEEFYSLIDGRVVYKGIGPDWEKYGHKPIRTNEGSFNPNGTYQTKLNAACCLWPSKELYEKYPLDAYSAWMEWKESRKLMYEMKVSFQIIGNNQDDQVGQFDTIRCNSLSEAIQITEAVKEVLQKFHEQYKQ